MKNLNILFDLLNYQGEPSNNPNDSTKVHNTIQECGVHNFSRQEMSIVAATTDLSIPLPGNPTTYLAILVDQTISIKLNGSITEIELVPKIACRKTLVFFNRGNITSLTITNHSTTTTANVDIIAITTN